MPAIIAWHLSWNNRKVLVTGGDSGIGRAATIAFAREGADVAINYLTSEETDAREVISLIEAEGRKAIALPGDLKDEKFCLKLVKRGTQKELGGPGILACIAGKQHAVEKIADVTTKQLEGTLPSQGLRALLAPQGRSSSNASGRNDFISAIAPPRPSVFHEEEGGQHLPVSRQHSETLKHLSNDLNFSFDELNPL